jgi:hypothetical protein
MSQASGIFGVIRPNFNPILLFFFILEGLTNCFPMKIKKNSIVCLTGRASANSEAVFDLNFLQSKWKSRIFIDQSRHSAPVELAVWL